MIHGTFIEAFGILSQEIAFLSRAVGHEEIRFFMNHIHVEPSEIEAGKFRGVATDGRRLHIIDPLSYLEDLGLEEGNWRPLKQDGKYSWMAQIKDDAGMFPAYRRVIPQGEPLFTFTMFKLMYRKMWDTASLVDFFRKFPEPTALNMQYLTVFNSDREWVVKWYGSDKAVLFESDSYTVVIQPMHI